MLLQCLGSSSKGNCYLLKADNGETLVLECGIPFKEIKKAMAFQISSIVGALVTHRHGDHAKYAPQLLDAGIEVWAIEDVFKSFAPKSSVFSRTIQAKKKYKIGMFSVLPLSVVHDVPCVCFVIEHEEMGKLLFVTDTMDLDYQIKGLNHILLEANYSKEILLENIHKGLIPPAMKRRLEFSHMEINTTLEVLQNTDLTNVNEIVLVHLSGSNSDPNEFVQRVQETTGKPSYIANNRLKIEINKEPF